MEIDFQHAAARAEPVRTQVCVAGAGIAGILLAHRLAERNVDVVLLEAGGESVRADEGSNAAAERAGLQHRGSTETQSRAFGGTSLRWGGQLLPLLETAQDAWPVDAAAMAPFVRQAETLLGVDHLSFEAERFFPEAGLPSPALLAGLMEIDGWMSKWTPFARRNLAKTLGRTLLRHPRVRVCLHAQVTELVTTPDGAHVRAAVARTPGGGRLSVEAAQFAVAAGTVETVRLLLASRGASAAGVGNAHGQVGRNFHDHLTLPAAILTGVARQRLLTELRPWVVRAGGRRATLHSAKLVASAALCAQLEINPVLAHLTLEEPEGTGTAAMRSLLRARQGEGLRQALLDHAGKLPGAAAEALRLLWSAGAERRRYVSERAQVKLYLNAVQDTPSASRIMLSGRSHANGMPLAVVDWLVTEREVRTLRRFAGWLRERLSAQGLTGTAWNEALLADEGPLPGLDDARHAMGGACMGTDPRSSVVDADLAVHGVDNLSVASAATFPTGAAQLPTLPLMALTLRLAERLASQAKGPLRG